MIYIDADHLSDGLYNIKDGKIYKYKAKGGTVRAYKLTRRPQGEWIPSDTDGFVCSVCKNGYRNQPTLMGRPMFEYCPVCGARMKGADDYERAIEQMEHDMLYEPTYNSEDGSM